MRQNSFQHFLDVVNFDKFVGINKADF